MSKIKIRTINVKLYPNKKQREIIETNMDLNRFVWNRAVNHNEHTYTNIGKGLSKYELTEYITTLRKKHSWLREGIAQSYQQTIFRYHRSLTMFMKNAKKGIKSKYGKPKLKRKKYLISQSFDLPQGVMIIDDRYVKFPKLGVIRMRGMRKDIVIDRLLTSTVTMAKDGLITLSLRVVTKSSKAVTNMLELLGLDVGTRYFVTDNTGNKVKPIDFNKLISKKKHLQRLLQRRKKNSKRHAKTKHALTKLNRKISNIRKDFVHKLSTRYSLEYVNIAVEDLNIKQMIKNTKGTVENPNIDSKKKSRLNDIIVRQGWGIFFDMLEYKLDSRDGRLIRVNPEYTSQECNVCKSIDKISRKDEVFHCTSCGHKDHADINAAKNIHDRALSKLYHV